MTQAPEKYRNERDQSWPPGLYVRRDSYRFVRSVNGKRRVQILGAIPERDAIRMTNRFNADIEDGLDPINEQRKRSQTLKEFAYEVWLPKKKACVSDNTYERYRSVVDTFLYFIENHAKLKGCCLTDITYAVADDYATHRRTKPVFPNGRRKYTRCQDGGVSKKTLTIEVDLLSQLFREAIARDLIDTNPFEKVTAPKPSKKEVKACHNPLSETEERAIIKAAEKLDAKRTIQDNAKLADVIEFMVVTGLRDGELCHLEWSDVDFAGGMISVREKRVIEKRQVPFGKKAAKMLKAHVGRRKLSEPLFRDAEEIESSKIRLWIRAEEELLALKVGDIDFQNEVISSEQEYTWSPKGSEGDVPLCRRARELLERLKATSQSNFIFAHRDGGRCRVDILSGVKKAAKAAGIQGRMRTHDLRHTFAVRLREKGADLETLRGLMRHAEIKETLIYASYTKAEGQDAIMLLDG